MVQHVIKKWRDCWRAGQLDPFATLFNLSIGVDPEVYSSDIAPLELANCDEQEEPKCKRLKGNRLLYTE